MKQFACTTKPKTTPTKDIHMEKKVRVVDEFGTPLSGVHVIGAKSTITDAKGEATIQSRVAAEITFSYVGKETLQLPFAKIGDTVVLKDNIDTLDAVIINATKEDHLWKWLLGVTGVGLLVYANAKSKNSATKKKAPQAPKKVNL